MKELIGCCGIDCEKCDARIATVTNDDTLREKTARLWSELNHCEITPEMINCMGCRGEGIKSGFCEYMCPIRQCARGKGFETCGECAQLENCETVRSIYLSDPNARDNLK